MKKYIPGIIFLVVFVITMIFVFRHVDERANERLAEINIEYPSLTTDQLANVRVSRLYKPKGFKESPYIAFVTLNKGEKITLHVNRRKSPLDNLMDILVIGDSIVKESGTDSVYVIKTSKGVSRKYGFTLFHEQISK